MTNKETKKTVGKGKQMSLIDVGPKNLKQIIGVAKKYRSAVRRRMHVAEEEQALKAQVLELVEKAKLGRDDKGRVRFQADGYVITVTPRDNLVQVREKE